MGTMQRREKSRSRRKEKECQNDIKKLRRENEQLRREIWCLRDEYDKLEGILKRQKNRGESDEYEDRSEEDDALHSEYSCEEEEILVEEEEEDYDEEEEEEEEEHERKTENRDDGMKNGKKNEEERLENAENQKISTDKMNSTLHRLHVDFDDLSVVDEEEELKKDREKKSIAMSSADSHNHGQSVIESELGMITGPRRLQDNFPFYPSAYNSPGAFTSSSFHPECPFEFSSVLDPIVATDSCMLAPPCSRVYSLDQCQMPSMNLEVSGRSHVCPLANSKPMLPAAVHVPSQTWQSNAPAAIDKRLSNCSTLDPSLLISTSSSPIPPDTSPKSRVPFEGLKMMHHQFGSPSGSSLLSHHPTLLQRRMVALKPPHKLTGANPFDSNEENSAMNNWRYENRPAEDQKSAQNNETDRNGRCPGANDNGPSSAEKPKHFFAPLPSKLKLQRCAVEEGGRSVNASLFDTGISTGSDKTESTIILGNHASNEKGSADICVTGAIPCENGTLWGLEKQETFLSTDSGTMLDGKSVANGIQITKSLSCQDLTSDPKAVSISEQYKVSGTNCKQQMFAKSDNTLDSIHSYDSGKPFKTQLNVTLRSPKAKRSETPSPETPEIPELPSMDYRLFRNPFIKNFHQPAVPTAAMYADQRSALISPLSVQTADNKLGCPHSNLSALPPAFTRQFNFSKEPCWRTTQGQVDPNHLLIPFDPGETNHAKATSPMGKSEIQVTSFEKPSPRTVVSSSNYDLDTLRKMTTANRYLQNQQLYQNVPFVPRTPTHFCQQPGAMRMFCDNVTKVPAQTQTSLTDGDSHQEEEQQQQQQQQQTLTPRQAESNSGPNSPPGGQRRKKLVRKDKTCGPTTTTTTTIAKSQRLNSPAAQRRLSKQSNATSSEAPESPQPPPPPLPSSVKIGKQKPRKLSITTTTTSEVPEEKNESRSSSSGQDSPRKEQTRRVSLYFNAKKRPSLTSVKTNRSGSLDVSKNRCKEGGGVVGFDGHAANSDRERTNSFSSREMTGGSKPRKASTSSGNVPWCACWGNGCI